MLALQLCNCTKTDRRPAEGSVGTRQNLPCETEGPGLVRPGGEVAWKEPVSSLPVLRMKDSGWNERFSVDIRKNIFIVGQSSDEQLPREAV